MAGLSRIREAQPRRAPNCGRVSHLAALPVEIGGPLFVGSVVALAIILGFAVQRVLPQAVLREHNDIAGFILAVVGVVYAVLLAFLAIGVWERFTTAEARTYDEANQLAVLYRYADVFPNGHVLRREIASYAEIVVREEWPAMNRGEQSTPADNLIERVAYEVRHLPVKTPVEQNVQAAMLASLNAVMIDRDDRLSMGATGVNAFLWGILILGGIGTMFFSYLFAFKNRGAQMLMIGLLAFSLGLVLYLIAAVDYPFRGEVSIGPEAFENAMQTFKTIGP